MPLFILRINRSTGRLDDAEVARIVSRLSDRVSLLLEDAAAKLNLKSLLLLIEELCQLCRVQLSHIEEENIRYCAKKSSLVVACHIR